MRKTEIQLTTVEQATEYLRQALDIVDELGPPDDLRRECFVKAAELVSARQVFFEQPQAVALDPAMAASIRNRHQ